MTWPQVKGVWQHSRLTDPRQRFLLMAIADFIHEGEVCAWPTVENLAARAYMSVRTVQALLPKLVASGELEIEPGGGKGRSHRYRLTPQLLHRMGTPYPASSAPFGAPKGAELASQRVQNSSVKGAKPAPEPLIEPLVEPTTSTGGGDGVAVVALLVAAGVTKSTAQDLAGNHSHELIQRQLEWLPYRNVKTSREGMLVKAIRGDWPPPATWTAEQERRNRLERTEIPAVVVEPPRELTAVDRDKVRSFWALQLRRQKGKTLSTALYASVAPWFSEDELAGYGVTPPGSQAEARGA